MKGRESFRKVRVPVPPPGRRMRSLKDYDRRDNEDVVEEELTLMEE